MGVAISDRARHGDRFEIRVQGTTAMFFGDELPDAFCKGFVTGFILACCAECVQGTEILQTKIAVVLGNVKAIDDKVATVV